ncbi:signal transduction histidine kinase [Thermocatellispora tengchongensis]|uniref:Signal transduction histidine kinase n=1 Tax=Thermocatellispora tengchongensis TaxID=1073253 RepID=A0A840PQ03_9ACTN|nr:hypothetical protein [Thermocatellispora tengchongensis]MBB5139851.1 signal transduction histidine kinase [Thermocatellispora tengchongensis]
MIPRLRPAPHVSGEERTLVTPLSAPVSQSLTRARLHDVEHTRVQEPQRFREHLRKALNRRRRFTADASHELPILWPGYAPG